MYYSNDIELFSMSQFIWNIVPLLFYLQNDMCLLALAFSGEQCYFTTQILTLTAWIGGRIFYFTSVNSMQISYFKEYQLTVTFKNFFFEHERDCNFEKISMNSKIIAFLHIQTVNKLIQLSTIERI